MPMIKRAGKAALLLPGGSGVQATFKPIDPRILGEYFEGLSDIQATFQDIRRVSMPITTNAHYIKSAAPSSSRTSVPGTPMAALLVLGDSSGHCIVAIHVPHSTKRFLGENTTGMHIGAISGGNQKKRQRRTRENEAAQIARYRVIIHDWLGSPSGAALATISLKLSCKFGLGRFYYSEMG
ncbi:uncharacterized protein F5147DRAFT_655724 [Suillus discolor]|uniref:Uncharacterized protein n=1 Tax=Suillus discolor TaxID=1912936 RepID=A0A9P7JQF1_9AGAM|nr:uncharacterized protein F5147DRAFT_655724 [Suillus discolor]KAG2099890.1 hypothetical protein F5147DRAFT_655724 [Suillus discolor]